MELTHGGDWAGYRAKFGRDALDFSANVSPLGLPEGVALAIVNALPTADRYPDPLCRELRQKLSASENVHENQILCGNGAADLIFRLVLAKKPRRTLLPAPTFAEYASALKTVGCEVEYFFLKEENDFEITEELLSALHETIDMVFLCQPNNPTGQIVTSDFLEKLLKKCRACHATPVIDECFLDFLPEHESRTAKHFLAQFPELVILKAFTKLYAMAGVRLGYVLSGDEKLLENMREAGQPWAVSSLAQAAGVAALDETEYADRVRSLIARERPRMIASLRSLGLRRALDVFHQAGQVDVRIVDIGDAAVNDLAQVVGRDVGGHADRNALTAVDQKVREAAGQHAGFLLGLVKVSESPLGGALGRMPRDLQPISSLVS